MLRAHTASSRLTLLAALYFIQGLPYGFQITALPILLREQGVSLTSIGLASVLSLPWMIKAVWGPAVDRFSFPGFGRRKSWIVPLQAGLALSCAAALLVVHGNQPELRTVLWLVLAMNLCASTMDVAVDGLAVDLLRRSELGYGNIAQVVGYKAGGLVSGGLLVWAQDIVGWSGLFAGMTGLVVLALLLTLAFREEATAPVLDPRTGELPSVRGVLRTLFAALRLPSAGWLLLFVGSYKLGEAMADAMFKPFLIDAGFTASQIGLWVGTWGMVFSIAGSTAGGILASRFSLLGAVAITATLRLVAVAGEWWLAVITPTANQVIAVTCAESLFGGALTTALFAFMMSRVDRRIGATHYTVLATVEVLGKVPASAVSGILADATSYATVFGLATVLSAAFLLLLIPLGRTLKREQAAGDQLAT